MNTLTRRLYFQVSEFSRKDFERPKLNFVRSGACGKVSFHSALENGDLDNLNRWGAGTTSGRESSTASVMGNSVSSISLHRGPQHRFQRLPSSQKGLLLATNHLNFLFIHEFVTQLNFSGIIINSPEAQTSPIAASSTWNKILQYEHWYCFLHTLKFNINARISPQLKRWLNCAVKKG